MIDMSQNRVPYGLLTDEEKAALHEHEKAGGMFEYFSGGAWHPVGIWGVVAVYRTVPLPLTQDEIAWGRLPDWVEWVARDEDEIVQCYEKDPTIFAGVWSSSFDYRRIDDFPGIIIKRGTCDWKDSKQRRPKVREGARND